MFFNDKKKRAGFKIALVLAILAVVFFSLKFLNITEIYKTGSIQGLIGNLRTVEGALLFIALYSIRPLFVTLPASPMAIAAGALYGVLIGTLVVVIGALISGTVGFFAARFIGKDYFDRISNKKIKKIKAKIEEGSWRSVILLNFIGLSWDLVSISAGLSNIKYRDYLLAICISAPIQAALIVCTGSVLFSIRSFSDLFQLKILVVILVFTVVAASLIIKKRLKRKAASSKK